MRSTAILLLAAAACGYEAGPNPFADPVGASISGSVVNATGQTGNVIVLAYDAANPGPPTGTGRPVTFTTVNADAFTTDAATGITSAPFAFTDLPMAGLDERSFLVTALLDVDGNFNPVIGALAGATCGDWIGAYLGDLVNLQPASVAVEAGGLVAGIPVVLANPLLTQRPAFFLPDDPTLSKEAGIASFQSFRLTATAVHTDFAATSTTRDPAGKEPLPLDLPGPCPVTDEAACAADTLTCTCDPAATDPCDTAFQVLLVDADLDGVLDPYPAELQAAAGLKNVWPRVFLAYAGEALPDAYPTGYSELDLAETNNILGQRTPEYPYIERWVSEAYPFSVDAILGALAGPLNEPFSMRELEAVASPVFRHYWQGGQDGTDANGNFDYVDVRCSQDPLPETCARPVDLAEIPNGLWQVTVIEHTGQTWAVPNEIPWLGLPSTVPAAFDPDAQAIGVTVEP